MESADERQPLLPVDRDGSGESANSNNSSGDSEKWYQTLCPNPCDPTRWMHRFFMLILMCFLSFGSYYCYDNPAALERTIMTVMHVDTYRYTILYSIYSWPNVVLSVFGGVLIDEVFGIRIGAIVFSLFVVAGQVVFALGALVNMYSVMILGRFIFGLGGENLAVAQNTYAVLWFKGKELNMVFGLLLSISRVGSTVNMNINQKIYDALNGVVGPDYVRLGIVLMVGFGFCVLSLGCAFALGLFDRRAARITGRKSPSEGKGVSWRQLTWRERGSVLWVKTKEFCLDVKAFPVTAWLVFIICVAYYVTVFPFIGLAMVFLEEKYGFTNSEAGIVNSLVYIISAAASPFLGILVDKVGFNLFWLNLGTLATLGAHGMLAFLGFATYIPYLAMVLMGLAYSLLACALWPLVAFIVPESKLGTAYGIMQAIQNLGLAVVPLVAGVIVDNNGYLILEVFFCVCLCCALIVGILLYVVDAGQGGKLNLSAWARARLEKQEEEEQKLDKIPPHSPINEGGPSYTSPIAPNSAFQIRNRFLSKMGAKIPEHIATFNPLTTSYGAHVGVLK